MASSTGTPAARGSGVGSFRSFRVTCNRLLYQGFWDSGENGDTHVPSAKECDVIVVGGVVFDMQ